MNASSSTVKVSSPGVLEFPDSESDTPPPNSQTHSASRAPNAPNSAYELVVAIHDQEVIEALAQYDDDGERQAFAAAALKVGVTAMKVASGRLDADLIQRESAHLLRQVGSRLEQHSVQVNDQVNSKLKEYFHPESGRFNERVKRLVSKDGELEQVLRRQIGTKDSELAKTLLAHFGDDSPLMKRTQPNRIRGTARCLTGRCRGATQIATATACCKSSRSTIQKALWPDWWLN